MSASRKGHPLIFRNLRNIYSEEDKLICLPYSVRVYMCLYMCALGQKLMLGSFLPGIPVYLELLKH